MPNTVFFSWQADTPTRTGRNLIERALELAVARIGDDTTVEEAIRDLAVDRDTKDVPGSPPIVDTILRKIDAAAVFVPDLTFVGTRLDGRPTPNPNVLIEYGWALRALTHSRIVPIMNTAHGSPTATTLPFDLGHIRHPIQYHCPDGADDQTRKRARDELSKDIERGVRAVLGSDAFKTSLPKPAEPPAFVPRASEGVSPGRFRAAGLPIGVSAGFLGTREVRIANKPLTWFRLMPAVSPQREWSVSELKTHGLSLNPLLPGWGGYDYIRSHEGFGVYAPPGDNVTSDVDTLAAVFAFTTGEVWTVDAYLLDAWSRDGRNAIPLEEKHFRDRLKDYSAFLTALGISPPYRWIAGMENVSGRGIFVPPPKGHQPASVYPQGKCQVHIVQSSGTYTPGESRGATLKPFFTKIFDSCGIERPIWLDEVADYD